MVAISVIVIIGGALVAMPLYANIYMRIFLKISMSKIFLLLIIINLLNINAQVKDSLDTDSTWVSVPLPEINVDNGVRPISSLPKYIPIHNNKVYLYADYKKAKYITSSIFKIRELLFTIYLINNSSDTVIYDSNTLDSRIQKEYVNDRNQWARTSPCNGCGISCSIFYIKLAPGEYFGMWGRFNKRGKLKKIRYSFVGYQVEPSNEVYDRVELKEAEKAVYDELAFNTCTIDYFTRIITGDIPLKVPSKKAIEIRSLAIRVMISRYKEKAIPFLEIIANTQDHILQNVAKDAIKYYLDGRLN